jgi:hypothetical protein
MWNEAVIAKFKGKCQHSTGAVKDNQKNSSRHSWSDPSLNLGPTEYEAEVLTITKFSEITRPSREVSRANTVLWLQSPALCK